MQFFYILISIIGLYKWKFDSVEKKELPISTYPIRHHIFLFLLGSIASYLLIASSSYVPFINLPVLDAITTVILVIGTLLLIQRKLYSWIYLVVGDLIYIYIYGTLELWLLTAVMVLYSILGTYGYVNWKKLFLQQTPDISA